MPRLKKRKPKFSLVYHRPIRIYSIGVYFPERDPLRFEIEAHDYQYRQGSVFFYYIREGGVKEFSASFTHVAWVILKDQKTEDVPQDLPKEFGIVC